jgi:hypothetical protein
VDVDVVLVPVGVVDSCGSGAPRRWPWRRRRCGRRRGCLRGRGCAFRHVCFPSRRKPRRTGNPPAALGNAGMQSYPGSGNGAADPIPERVLTIGTGAGHFPAFHAAATRDDPDLRIRYRAHHDTDVSTFGWVRCGHGRGACERGRWLRGSDRVARWRRGAMSRRAACRGGQDRRDRARGDG